jgi:hypothetical protein
MNFFSSLYPQKNPNLGVITTSPSPSTTATQFSVPDDIPPEQPLTRDDMIAYLNAPIWLFDNIDTTDITTMYTNAVKQNKIDNALVKGGSKRHRRHKKRVSTRRKLRKH